ncbi:MAG: hypothetical protein ACFFD4_12035 [Candidatus Odinarchaeota archaeon]
MQNRTGYSIIELDNRDVLLTGGDPVTMNASNVEKIISENCCLLLSNTCQRVF